MTWLVWRQHRKQLLFGVATLVALAGFFVGTGLSIHHTFTKLGLPACLPQTMRLLDIPNADRSVAAMCRGAAETFFNGYGSVMFAGLLMLILPMLLGMFWGAPLVAREIETGTHRLVWTQGVSRLRWATSKIGLIGGVVVVMAAIYAAMLAWWITPVMQASGQRFGYIFFDLQGFVVFGYVLFALALGISAGAFTGKLLSSMAITVVGFLGARVAVMLLARPHFGATVTHKTPIAMDRGIGSMFNQLHGDWILSQVGFLPSGERLCTGAPRCEAKLVRGAYELVTYHPVHDFWLFQTYETAIFVGLAIGLLGAAIYLVRRRIS